MMKKRLGRAVSLLLCLSMLLGMIAPAAAAEDLTELQSASAGEYEIYPTPHQVTYGAQSSTVTLPETMQVTYGAGIDGYTKARAVEAFNEAGVTLSESAATNVKLQVSIDDTLNTSKYDAYTVTINAAGVTVVGQNTDAAFYGLTTVKRILQQVEDKTVRTMTVEDYADVPFRGFIEGYYGNPWSTDDRVSLMEFGGEYKMNIYFYAPKDDPKHSTKWRELYTEQELEEKIRPLAVAGNESKCYFGFALHPFWADAIRFDTDEHYEADLEILEAKYEQVMKVGVRQIAVLADDRGEPSVGAANSYVRLLTDLTEWVSSDAMQAKYPGLKTSIPFCPNDYGGNGSSAQLQALKALPDSVPVIMTGGQIWGHVEHSFLNTYTSNMGKGPFMWVNWPCSDNSKTSLTMGGHGDVLQTDLTQADIDALQGIMINPMQQSEPSKAGIFQLADYSWNIWNGSDSATRIANVWDDCFKYVDHDSAIEAPASNALRELSKHMIHQNGRVNGSYSKYEESVELAPKLTEFRAKLAAGTVTQADVAAVRSEFEKLNTAATLYAENAGNTRLLGERNADGSYPSGQEQMAPWLDCWEEFTQANLDLLDALSAMLDNADGSRDSVIVGKYLSGQSSLTASQSHRFFYVDYYETAKVGGQHLVPFTNDLLSVVAEEAQTIIDPTVIVETIITSRTDTPTGGLEAMRDGSTATAAVFKTPNSIAVGDYVGVRYNRAIPITSVRFEVGTADNANDTFDNSKLQYMDADGNWQDIPGAAFAHADLVLEATGLNLNAKGVRVIATSARTNTWLGIKEIYINGKSGKDDVSSTTPGEKLSGTVIKPSTWTVWGSSTNPESNLTDGDDSTYVWYQISGNKSVVGDYIGLDLGSVQNVGRVRFVVGTDGSSDKWTDYRLEYSADNTTWTEVKTYSSTANKDVVDEDLGGVSARYVRLVNTVEVPTWTRFSEIGIWSYASANNFEQIAYQSETVGRITNPVGELTDDSASLSASAVILKPGEFVGIALPRIRAITDIVADYTAAPGVVLEAGMNEGEMEAVTLSARTACNVDARYIRLRNASRQAVSFKLNELSVQSDEITDIHFDAGKTQMGLDANYGNQDNRESVNFFDGDLGTVTTLANAQTAGEYVTYDLGQLRPISKLVMAMPESNTNYLRHGVLEVSPDGNDDTWTTVLTVNNDGADYTEVKDGASSDPSFKLGVPQQNYVSFVGKLDEAVDARYLRIRVTEGGRSTFVAAAEILINTESLNDMEYLPTVNDPTFVADPIEQAGYAPANMRDGKLTTAFRPNMDGKTEGSIIYRLSDDTSIGQINVLGDATGSVAVSVRPVGGSDFQTLGTLTGGLAQVPVPEEITGVAEIKLSWGDTTPTIYELITVAREKVEEGGGQASSGEETVPINSYSGSDCSILFDENWKFNLGDASGAQAKVYNDSAWRTVNLPHDFSIEQDYTASGEAESGYLPGGTGWYRKSFTVDSSWANKTVTIDFGGAYMDTEVYLNGTKLGEHHYGYSPFSFVLPLDCAGENVIAVKVANPVPSSRWYSGSGIYRSVYLTVSEPVHVAKYGTYVTTTNAGAVTVKTNVQNDGASAANVTVEQAIYELDGATFEKTGDAVATAPGTAAAPAANGSASVTQTLNVASPKIWNSWDKGDPNLYVLVTTVKQGETVLDTYETEFGFREMDWDVDTGFELNGENLKLKGVCQHHDQGALGAEAWYRALERQVDILMDMGCNSIRVTHNPAADELIEICNRKGVLVIDELFDGWAHAKNGNSGDFSRWFNQTLGAGNNLVGGSASMKWQQFVAETVVNRDKNAPCVIMYSLCNEVQEGGGIDGNYPTYANELIGWIQAIDNTRYVTRGDNTRTGSSTGNQGLINQAIHDAGGAVGFNYYGGSANPILPGHNMGWRMYAAETVSHVNTRGVYDRKNSNSDGGKGDGLLTAYDKSAVGWGAVASDGWWRTIRYDYSAGEYIWTGFDYIGEPTPYNGTGSGKSPYWNGSFELAAKSSYFGAIDTSGLPKDNYYLYRSMWNDKSHTLHILPTWDEQDIMIDSNGKVEVVVYTDAPMVKLYLNDVEVGSATSTTQTTPAGHVYRTFNAGTGAFVSKAATSHETLYATFNVTYAKGTLKAVACDASGNPLGWVTKGRSEVKTTKGASKLVLTADCTTIKNDGRDLSYITIDVTDASGEIVNGATPEITVSVTGDGVLMGLDNGVQPDHTSYLSSTRKAGAGRLVAIVQSTKSEGSFTVTATANGLASGSTTVETSGVTSAVSSAPVSYDIARTIYVQRGVTPELPSKASVTLGDGTEVEGTVAWDSWDSGLLNTVGNEFAITGTITIPGYSIPVSVGVVVVDNVVALLNYSTAVQVGGAPILPAARPAVMADGTVLSAQFPVTWEDPVAGAYDREGTVEVTGTANVFGKTFTVTAWVRVSAGGVAEGSSVSNAVQRPVVNGVENDALLRAYDGDANTVWSGSGTTNVEFDTAQNLYRIKLTYQGAAPTSGVTLTLDGGAVTVRPKIEGSTATYELGGISSSVNVTLTFSSVVSLAEVELIVGTPTFDTYSTAVLDGLKFNGENASASSLASRVVRTSLLMPAIVPETGSNVAYTILPEDNGKVIIVTESEDNSSRDKYTVYLGAPEDVDAEDDSHDYPYGQTTATAPSQQSGNAAGNVTDANSSSIWHTSWAGTDAENLYEHPENRYIQLTLDAPAELVALRYLPRSSGGNNGMVTEYRVEVSTDGVNFTPVASGSWEISSDWKIAMFGQSVTAQYVRLYGVKTVSDHSGQSFMSCAELRVVTASTDEKEDLSLATVTVSPDSFHWKNVEIYPDTVTVSLFGETLTEGVDYTLDYENNRNPGTAYVYAIAKEGGKYKGSAYGTFTIVRSDATIVSLEPRTIWIQEGVEPELPETIWAAMSDGHHLAQNVVWDSIPVENYMNPTERKFTVSGTVAGTDLTPTLTVNVAFAQSADSVSAMTAIGTPPTLTREVNVQFDDGTSRKCGVTWGLGDVNWNEAGMKTVTGTLTGIDPARATATATVRVGTATPSNTNIALNTDSASNIFPFAMGYVSAGNNNPYQAVKGTTTASTAVTDRWSDWERDTYHTDPKSWLGVAFETGTTLGDRQQNQVLSLKPHLVNKVKVMFVDESGTGGAVTFPESYKIQYYTGPSDVTFDTRMTTQDLNTAGNGVVRSWTGSPLLDDDNWADVTVKGTQPTVPSSNGRMLEIEFEQVNTTIIRVVCTPKENKWSGIQALEVYGLDLPEAKSDFTVTSVKLGGVDKLSEFNADKVLEVELGEDEAIPALSVTVDSGDNASVSITQASRVPGLAQAGSAWAVAKITSEDDSKTDTYTVKFTRAGMADKKYTIAKTGAGAEKITLSETSAAPGTVITIGVAKGYELSAPWVMITRCDHADNDHYGQHVDVENNQFTMPMGDVSLSATVTAIPYKITYELNGGEVEISNRTEYTVESNDFTLRNPEKAGYVFLGWTGTDLPDEPTKTVTIAKGSTGDRTYTANWERNAPNSYAINYELNGGTLAEPNPDSYTSETPTFTLHNPTRSGYTFLGWTGSGLREVTLIVTIEQGSIGRRSYIANWEKNEDPTPPTPTTPTVPVNPAPSGSDDTTTKVEKNDDGSTTTTVTDNKTGVVTATTEKVDGSKVVKVTEADQDVTITVTNAEGEVLVKVELPAEIPAPETRFTDVPEGHWADEAIHNMAALEIVKGVGNNTFNRNGAMKRGDLALLLSRMSNGGDGYKLPFTDVPAGKYYADGVAWAAKTGVVTGRSEDTFAPEDTITREELAVMLCRYAALIGIDTSASNAELDAFADGGDTHGWAANGMAWCVKNGILQGRSNGGLDPRTNVTRAEVAVMLQRFMELMK